MLSHAHSLKSYVVSFNIICGYNGTDGSRQSSSSIKHTTLK